jgi:hypothetical protein
MAANAAGAYLNAPWYHGALERDAAEQRLAMYVGWDVPYQPLRRGKPSSFCEQLPLLLLLSLLLLLTLPPRALH